MIDYEDDDLRTLLDNMNKNEESNETVVTEKVSGKEDVEKFASAFDVSNDVRQLASRVDQLEVLNYGLWLMLEKKRFCERVSSSALSASFFARLFSSANKRLCSHVIAKHTVAVRIRDTNVST